MAQSESFEVIIIGAGITGLVLAQALKKAGIKYQIFEREVQMNYRSNEWTMAIHWSLERLEKLLPKELWEKLPTISCNPAVPMDAGGNYPIIHGETGSLLAGVPYARGLRVPRSKMRALCAEGIDVQYGMELTDAQFDPSGTGVTATFNNSTQLKASLVIGTDGPRSTIRKFAMGSESEASTSKFPIFHTNMTVCYGDADKARYLRQEFPTSYLALSEKSYHAFQSISSMPDGPDHPETWVFHLAMAWLGDTDQSMSYPERLALIKSKAGTLGEPARSAFTWIPEDTLVHKADISYWISKPWNNQDGRITLAGDAAHAMPPYRGQGLNHCICDVSHFLEKIQAILGGDISQKDAITAYDDEVVKRGAEEVKCSLENGLMLHDWEKIKESPVFTTGFKPMTGHDGANAHKRMLPEDAKALQEVQQQIATH
jgi:2-polyprenyl-6-methoxyphenol hydroxylase-like FAD-dependent oxidoreductase